VFEPQTTPAYIYDERRLRSDVDQVGEIARSAGCTILYSPKANSLRGVLDVVASAVDGFAASSIFEARLARQVLGARGSVHLTNPGLRADEVADVTALCDYVSLNSLSQWDLYAALLTGRVKCGLRVNPGLSLVRDLRYDPCRENSKLGVPLAHLEEIHHQVPSRIAGISGLHFHTNSEASEFSGLLATIRHLADRIGPFLEEIEWINLGGGYLFDDPDTLGEFHESIDLLRSRYGLEVFVEPGTAMVRQSGYLVSSVVDIFVSGDKSVAILDATTNHWPEVFEYDFAPDVIGDREEGEFEYLLAGGTCLAGDLFGTYAFDAPLDVGSKVVFANAGAYALVKANYFNGINLPSIYALTAAGDLVLEKKFTYADFARQCGAVEHENN
jgi:carboxynorspermidine decarboxylase